MLGRYRQLGECPLGGRFASRQTMPQRRSVLAPLRRANRIRE
jgi:hypothetical protein